MRPLVSPPTVVDEFGYEWTNWIYQNYETIKAWGISGDSNTSMTVTINEIDSLTVDDSTAASETRLLLYDVDTGALQRVSVGSNDSGGAGFRLLRIPNV